MNNFLRLIFLQLLFCFTITYTVVKQINISCLHRLNKRNIFQYAIANNINLISNENLLVKQRDGKLPLVTLQQNRPLVVLLTWILANQKHVDKFIDLYIKKGFDVVTLSSAPWDLILPKLGGQVSASKILDFLYENVSFQPVIVHGFSAGCYVWIEVLVKVTDNLNKYKDTINRVKGQIYDSAPPPPSIFPKRFSYAVFPNNSFFRSFLEKAISLEHKVFFDSVTMPLLRSTEVYRHPPAKTPTLLFMSKDDPITPFDEHMEAYENWKLQDIKAYVKWWEHSPHVGHFRAHPEEYVGQLNSFLDSIDLKKI